MARTTLERTEADQSLAAADIEQALTRCEAGAVEHLVADTAEVIEHPAAHFRVAAVAVLRQPSRPDVALPARARLALGAFRRRRLHRCARQRERPWLRLRQALRLLGRGLGLRLLLLGEDIFLGGACE